MGKDKKKKFIRYQDGAEIYSMSMRRFQDLAKDAGAIYKVGKMALVNCEILDEYLLDDTLNVGILDSIMVDEKYRGSKLQLQIMNYLEE